MSREHISNNLEHISNHILMIGALDGVPMSRVDFNKWQCRMSLLLIFADVPCRI